MYDVISLVLVALVVAVGAAGLFGARRRAPAVVPSSARRRRQISPAAPGSGLRLPVGPPATGTPLPRPGTPPAFRNVRPLPPPPPVGAIAIPGGPSGAYDTQLLPVTSAADEEVAVDPDPDAVVIARSGPSAGGDRR